MNEDFLGFTFVINGTEHKSQDLGIIRVSDGDRYKDQLIPEIEDKTIEIPGLDGSYLYGSDFKPRNFSISIAFDSMTEKQLRDMRTVFGYKQTGLLIFDEAPYKAYRVKVATPPELNYVCFDERETELVNFNGIKGPTTVYRNQEGTKRIYKGDGTIEFVAYYPFAKSTAKQLDSFNNSNKNEWAEASGMCENLATLNIDTYEEGETESIGSIKVFNPGDVPTSFRLYIPFLEEQSQLLPINHFQLSYCKSDLAVKDGIDSISPIDNDIGILIDTGNQLVCGVLEEDNDQFKTSGNLYNNYITGEFFKIKLNTDIHESEDERQEIIVQGLNNQIKIYYDYLYF